MRKFPVLRIGLFQEIINDDEFYTNVFSKHLEQHRASISIPHKHDFYLVVLFTHGSGRHEVDFTSFEIGPGSLFCMKPGQTHHWEFTTSPEGYIFFHSREFFEVPEPHTLLDEYPMYMLSKSQALIQINLKNDLGEVVDFFRSIYKESKEEMPFKRARLRNLIEQVYIFLSRKIYANDPETIARKLRPHGRLRELERLIDQNYRSQLRASEYASMLNVSSKHLNKQVQMTYGKTITGLIHERVLLEAKRLLVRKDLPINEIAAQLGFEDTAYFNRLFKKKSGITPREFANRY